MATEKIWVEKFLKWNLFSRPFVKTKTMIRNEPGNKI